MEPQPCCSWGLIEVVPANPGLNLRRKWRSQPSRSTFRRRSPPGVETTATCPGALAEEGLRNGRFRRQLARRGVGLGGPDDRVARLATRRLVDHVDGAAEGDDLAALGTSTTTRRAQPVLERAIFVSRCA